MLVYCFAVIARPFPESEAALLRFPEVLSSMAATAYREGEELRAHVRQGRAPFAQAVRLDVDRVLRRGDHTTIPVTWEATGMPGLFPRMEADLALEPLGGDHSHLSFSGSYVPPLGALGTVADRLLLHRVAEATVKRFTDALAGAIAAADVGQLVLPAESDASTPA